jgi:hypothetical protein
VIGHGEDEQAIRLQRLPADPKHADRVVQMLEHIGHDDAGDAARLDHRVFRGAVLQDDAALGGERAGMRRGLAPRHLPACLAEIGQIIAARGTDLEDATQAGRRKGQHRAAAHRIGQRPQERAQRTEAVVGCPPGIMRKPLDARPERLLAHPVRAVSCRVVGADRLWRGSRRQPLDLAGRTTPTLELMAGSDVPASDRPLGHPCLAAAGMAAS